MNRITLLLLILLSGFKIAFGQVDKEFWFAAPEITSSHEDRPVYLRISTTSLASVVTISIPANGGFTPIVLNLAANTTFSQDLTQWIDNLENTDPYSPQNKGLHITATTNISAYYEVLGTRSSDSKVLNSDLFPLKGKNALGTRFYTPFQNKLENSNLIDAWSSFDIVAAENNTTITITPTKNIVGHGAGVPFNITLNRGQTYSAKASGKLGADHLSGSLIVSDKPIAVTIKDDSVVQNTAWDMLGDQLIPVSMLGTDYIVVKGLLTPGADIGERAIIGATVNGTEIRVGGVLMATINAGQVYNHPISATAPAEYIKASQPVYVFHVSGFGYELGGAIIPPIICTGSRSINFTRSTTEDFYVNILVKTTGISNFKLNGSATLIPASAFTTVLNTPTAGEWSTAQILFNTTDVPSGSNNVITNTTSEFHVGTINGQATGAGARYGYFSDFGGLTGGTAAATPSTICESATAVLNLTNNVGDIQWQQSADGTTNWADVTTGSGDTTVSYTTQTLTPGAYYYRAILSGSPGSGCAPAYSNVVPVTVQPVSNPGTTSASADTICQNTATSMQVVGNTGSIQWQQSPNGTNGWANINGATSATYNTPNLTTTSYFRAVITNGVCSSVNSAVITITVDSLSVGGTATANDPEICENTSTTVTVSGHTGSIQWQQSANGISGWVNVTGGSGATSATYTTPDLDDTTYYRAVITNGVCILSQNSAVAKVTVNPFSKGGNATAAKTPVCTNESTTITLSGYTGTIQWQDSTSGSAWQNVTAGSGGTDTTYTTPGLTDTIFYRAVVKSGDCQIQHSAIQRITVSSVSIGGTATAAQSPICLNDSTSITVVGHTGTIQWQKSSDVSSGWVDVTDGTGITASTYNTPKLTATTYYRAKVTNGGCASVNSDTAGVVVNPPTVAGTSAATPPQICANTNTIVKVTGNPVGALQWQQTTDTTVVGSWTNVTGGSGATTTDYTTPFLTTKTFYRALVSSGGCASSSSSVATVSVDSISDAGNATADKSPVCANTNTIVRLTGYTGGSDFSWQESTDSINWTTINPAAMNSSYTTPDLTQTMFYRALVTNGVCSSDTSDGVKVKVDAVSAGGTAVSNVTATCKNTSAIISLTNYTGAIQWEQSPDTLSWSVIPLATADTYTTGSLDSTVYFRAVVTSGVCSSDTSVLVKVQVDTTSNPGTPAVAKSPVCSGDVSTLTLIGYKGAIQWQDSVTGAAGWANITGADSSPYTTVALTATTYYRALVKSGVCDADTSDIVEVKVSLPTSTGTISTVNSPLCAGNTAMVQLTGAVGDTIQWQQSLNGTTSWLNVTGGSGGTTASYTTAALTTSLYFKAIVKSGACDSLHSGVVKVDVNPVTVGGTITADTSAFCGSGKAKLTLIGYEGTIQWQDSVIGASGWANIIGANSSSYTTAVLTATTYYRTIVKSGVCDPEFSGIMEIVINTRPVAGTASSSPFLICANASTTVNLTGYTGNLVWEQSIDTLAGSWTNAGITTPSFTTPNLPVTTFYRASVTTTGCPASKSGIATVLVRPFTNIKLGNDTIICEGTTILLAPPGFADYLWSDGSTKRSLLVTKPGTYTLSATDSLGCEGSGTIFIGECDDFMIPNIFTPNDDLENQAFVIRGNRPGSKLYIYNRWGTEVYHKLEYDNTWEGVGLSEGTYYYIYERRGDKIYKGWVEIIR